MKEYHKINSVYRRDTKGAMQIGVYSEPIFEYLKDNPWVFTEKVDGTNIRVMFNKHDDPRGPYTVKYGGKTDAAQIPAKLVERLIATFGPLTAQAFDMFKGDGACLYGEGYGAGIQSGGNYRPDQDFVLFDVKVGDWWLQREDVEDVAQKLGLRVVPVLREGTLAQMEKMCRDGFMSTWNNFVAEGIVARPKVEMRTRRGDRIITKLKHKDFARLAVAA
jgi:hypothetical protein